MLAAIVAFPMGPNSPLRRDREAFKTTSKHLLRKQNTFLGSIRRVFEGGTGPSRIWVNGLASVFTAWAGRKCV